MVDLSTIPSLPSSTQPPDFLRLANPLDRPRLSRRIRLRGLGFRLKRSNDPIMPIFVAWPGREAINIAYRYIQVHPGPTRAPALGRSFSFLAGTSSEPFGTFWSHRSSLPNRCIFYDHWVTGSLETGTHERIHGVYGVHTHLSTPQPSTSGADRQVRVSGLSHYSV